MYRRFKDEFTEMKNPTLESINSDDVYGIRIVNSDQPDLPYLFNHDFHFNYEENLSLYKWFKHSHSGSDYREIQGNLYPYCKIEYDKAIEFIKRYTGIDILETAPTIKYTKIKYFSNGKKDIRDIGAMNIVDEEGELSAYIGKKYYNLYVVHQLEQKIDHDFIVQINSNEAAFLLSSNLPLETIYAYDGTDVTTICKSSDGYLAQCRPAKNNIDKARGFIQVKSILDNKYKNCKFFKHIDMPNIETNPVNGDQYIEIDKKYAADFIKNKKHVFDLDKDNTISGTYFLSRDKNILYDDVIDGQRKCNVDLSRHLFIEQKDYYDYISMVIKKIIGNEEEDEMTDLYDRALQLSEFKFFVNLAKEYRKGIYDSNDRYLPVYRIMPMILKECFDKSDKDPKILVGKCIDKSISLIRLYIITGGREVEKFAYWLFNDENIFSDCYDNVQEDKFAHINCPDYKAIISAFNKLDIATKKKLYNSICVMAHKFDDDFYDFYINQYRSVENKLSENEVIIKVGVKIPLLMFAGFYKIYTNNVNNRVYFTKMIGDLYSAMLNDINSDINSFIISFMENKDHDKECYLNKNDSHDAEIYFNQLESISVDFADFLKNELFVELKKVNPNI